MKTRLLWLAALSGLVVLAAVPAVADDVAVHLGTAILRAVAPFLLALAVLLTSLYIASIVFVEAAALNAFLSLGYWRSFRYSFLVNMLSFLIGVLWYAATRAASGPGHEYIGWKTAFAGDASVTLVLWLLIRSFLVTVLAEALLLIGLLSRERRSGDIFAGLVFANVLSYGLSVVVMALWLLRR